MADTLETQIIGTLQQTVAAIQANMQAKGINASGRTSASVHVRTYEGGMQIVAGNNAQHNIEAPGGGLRQFDTAPFPTVEIGRPGGAVPRGFYYIIKQWTREKGLSFADESERATFAYFTARKIAREGTERNKRNEDVYSTVVQAAASNIRQLCSDYLARSVRAAIGGFAIKAQTN